MVDSKIRSIRSASLEIVLTPKLSPYRRFLEVGYFTAQATSWKLWKLFKGNDGILVRNQGFLSSCGYYQDLSEVSASEIGAGRRRVVWELVGRFELGTLTYPRAHVHEGARRTGLERTTIAPKA